MDILYLLIPVSVVIVFAIGVTSWMQSARIVRGEVLALKEREFVLAARSIGTPSRRMILRHILPNVLSPIMVAATLGIASAIITESALSFLGLGVQEPMSSWGALVNDGAQDMESSPWTLIFPATFLAVTLYCFNYIGDGMRDALDPKDRV